MVCTKAPVAIPFEEARPLERPFEMLLLNRDIASIPGTTMKIIVVMRNKLKSCIPNKFEHLFHKA